MPLRTFHSALQGLDPLVQLVRAISARDPALTYAGLAPTVEPLAVGSAVVLAVARFEEYLKNLGDFAARQYANAVPPVLLKELPHEFQVQMLEKNFSAAMRANRFGVARTPQDRMRGGLSVARRALANDVWGGDAIETHSNPNPDTVGEILTLVGVAKPWKKLDAAWSVKAPLGTGHARYFKDIPSARKELQSVLTARNTVAHSGSNATVGPQELLAILAFLYDFAEVLYDVAQVSVDAQVVSIGRTPAAWP